jgi:tetratricopeptide (TPR) repeat protein
MEESPLMADLRRQYGENPRRVFARFANEYRKQGDLITAIEICRTQVPLQPTYISGYIVLGQALFESGQLEEARSTFEAAIGLDPENLIALRQLGDVARMTGDIEGARGWYYKLLEVDPGNDEVRAHVKAMEASSAQPPAVERSPEAVSWSDINPERVTVPSPVTLPPLPRLTLGMIPEDLSPDPARAPVNEPIEMSGPEGGAANAAPAAQPPAPTAYVPLVPPARTGSLASAPPPTLEITGLEEFAQFSTPIAPPPAPRPSLPDISAFAPPPPPPTPSAAELPPIEPMTGEFSAAGVQHAPIPDLVPDEGFQPPPRHPEEEEPALWSPPELAKPVDFLPPRQTQPPPAAESLRDTQSFATPVSMPIQTPTPAPPAPPAAPDPRAGVPNWGSVTDRDEVEAASAAAPAPQAQEEAYDPTVGRMLDLNVNSGTEIPAAFMTETMAELYLQQGYQEEALRIYRQLAAMRPDDPSLRERIARLEKGARSSVSIAAAVSEEVITAARDRASRPAQTIRSLFGGLAARKAPVTPSSVSPTAPAVAVPSAERRAPSPVVEAPVASNGAATLSTLFTERVAPADDDAATALAGAFNEEFSGTTPAPASGAPSRAASQPLSLDDVFRGQKPTTEQKRQSDSVSFDEFFSPRDSGSMPAVRTGGGDKSADSGGGRAPEADLALFHDWLDGLKK